jgi:hypothetical protein
MNLYFDKVLSVQFPFGHSSVSLGILLEMIF